MGAKKDLDVAPRRRISKMAIASLVCAIIGLPIGAQLPILVPIFGVVAMVLGFVANSAIKKDKWKGGGGVAFAGTVLGVLLCLAGIAVLKAPSMFKEMQEMKETITSQTIPEEMKETIVSQTIPEDLILVKCRNPECQAEYQMGKKPFYIALAEATNPGAATDSPGLACRECGKPTIHEALRCPNPGCGVVFILGTVPSTFPDRCPKCGKSETEERRNRRATRNTR